MQLINGGRNRSLLEHDGLGKTRVGLFFILLDQDQSHDSYRLEHRHYSASKRKASAWLSQGYDSNDSESGYDYRRLPRL